MPRTLVQGLCWLLGFYVALFFAPFYARSEPLPDPESARLEQLLFEQVNGTMLATVFVFLGVEGASVYSRYARKRQDVGRATVLGFLSVLAVFASVTIVSYGILPRNELAKLRQPSMVFCCRAGSTSV